ncbi:MAG TPA: hypothetical protein VF753_19635 [Terriglobales bacterium]
MALQAPVLNEFQMITKELSAIREVECAFIDSTGHSGILVTVILPNSDPSALDKVVNAESNVMNAFPWLNIDFEVVLRAERALHEVVSPKGSLLFAR